MMKHLSTFNQLDPITVSFAKTNIKCSHKITTKEKTTNKYLLSTLKTFVYKIALKPTFKPYF